MLKGDIMNIEESVEEVEDEDNKYTVVVGEDIYQQVEHFKKVIDAMIGVELESIDDYIKFILKIGMMKMLLDAIPDDMPLQMTMVAMFEENPEYICEFVSRAIKKGKNKKIKEKSAEWINMYG